MNKLSPVKLVLYVITIVLTLHITYPAGLMQVCDKDSPCSSNLECIEQTCGAQTEAMDSKFNIHKLCVRKIDHAEEAKRLDQYLDDNSDLFAITYSKYSLDGKIMYDNDYDADGIPDWDDWDYDDNGIADYYDDWDNDGFQNGGYIDENHDGFDDVSGKPILNINLGGITDSESQGLVDDDFDGNGVKDIIQDSDNDKVFNRIIGIEGKSGPDGVIAGKPDFKSDGKKVKWGRSKAYDPATIKSEDDSLFFVPLREDQDLDGDGRKEIGDGLVPLDCITGGMQGTMDCKIPSEYYRLNKEEPTANSNPRSRNPDTGCDKPNDYSYTIKKEMTGEEKIDLINRLALCYDFNALLLNPRPQDAANRREYIIPLQDKVIYGPTRADLLRKNDLQNNLNVIDMVIDKNDQPNIVFKTVRKSEADRCMDTKCDDEPISCGYMCVDRRYTCDKVPKVGCTEIPDNGLHWLYYLKLTSNGDRDEGIWRNGIVPLYYLMSDPWFDTEPYSPQIAINHHNTDDPSDDTPVVGMKMNVEMPGVFYKYMGHAEENWIQWERKQYSFIGFMTSQYVPENLKQYYETGSERLTKYSSNDIAKMGFESDNKNTVYPDEPEKLTRIVTAELILPCAKRSSGCPSSYMLDYGPGGFVDGVRTTEWQKQIKETEKEIGWDTWDNEENQIVNKVRDFYDPFYGDESKTHVQKFWNWSVKYSEFIRPYVVDGKKYYSTLGPFFMVYSDRPSFLISKLKFEAESSQSTNGIITVSRENVRLAGYQLSYLDDEVILPDINVTLSGDDDVSDFQLDPALYVDGQGIAHISYQSPETKELMYVTSDATKVLTKQALDLGDSKLISGPAIVDGRLIYPIIKDGKYLLIESKITDSKASSDYNIIAETELRPVKLEVDDIGDDKSLVWTMEDGSAGQYIFKQKKYVMINLDGLSFQDIKDITDDLDIPGSFDRVYVQNFTSLSTGTVSQASVALTGWYPAISRAYGDRLLIKRQNEILDENLLEDKNIGLAQQYIETMNLLNSVEKNGGTALSDSVLFGPTKGDWLKPDMLEYSLFLNHDAISLKEFEIDTGKQAVSEMLQDVIPDFSFIDSFSSLKPDQIDMRYMDLKKEEIKNLIRALEYREKLNDSVLVLYSAGNKVDVSKQITENELANVIDLSGTEFAGFSNYNDMKVSMLGDTASIYVKNPASEWTNPSIYLLSNISKNLLKIQGIKEIYFYDKAQRQLYRQDRLDTFYFAGDDLKSAYFSSGSPDILVIAKIDEGYYFGKQTSSILPTFNVTGGGAVILGQLDSGDLFFDKAELNELAPTVASMMNIKHESPYDGIFNRRLSVEHSDNLIVEINNDMTKKEPEEKYLLNPSGNEIISVDSIDGMPGYVRIRYSSPDDYLEAEFQDLNVPIGYQGTIDVSTDIILKEIGGSRNFKPDAITKVKKDQRKNKASITAINNGDRIIEIPVSLKYPRAEFTITVPADSFGQINITGTDIELKELITPIYNISVYGILKNYSIGYYDWAKDYNPDNDITLMAGSDLSSMAEVASSVDKHNRFVRSEIPLSNFYTGIFTKSSDIYMVNVKLDDRSADNLNKYTTALRQVNVTLELYNKTNELVPDSNVTMGIDYSIGQLFDDYRNPIWWNFTWAYRRDIRIVNPGISTLLQSYTMTINLSDPKFNFNPDSEKILSDYSDLRLVYQESGEDGILNTEDDKNIELDRKIENAVLTFSIYKSITSGSADSNYRIYYGNPNAEQPQSDPKKLYELYDEFDSKIDARLNGHSYDVTAYPGWLRFNVRGNMNCYEANFPYIYFSSTFNEFEFETTIRTKTGVDKSAGIFFSGLSDPTAINYTDPKHIACDIGLFGIKDSEDTLALEWPERELWDLPKDINVIEKIVTERSDLKLKAIYFDKDGSKLVNLSYANADENWRYFKTFNISSVFNQPKATIGLYARQFEPDSENQDSFYVDFDYVKVRGVITDPKYQPIVTAISNEMNRSEILKIVINSMPENTKISGDALEAINFSTKLGYKEGRYIGTIYTPAKDGSYVVHVKANYTGNFTANDDLNIIMDVTPPNPVLISPDRSFHLDSTLNLSFYFTEQLKNISYAIIDENAIQVYAYSSGMPHSFSFFANSLNFSKGQYTLSINSSDLSGNIGNYKSVFNMTSNNTALKILKAPKYVRKGRESMEIELSLQNTALSTNMTIRPSDIQLSYSNKYQTNVDISDKLIYLIDDQIWDQDITMSNYNSSKVKLIFRDLQSLQFNGYYKLKVLLNIPDDHILDNSDSAEILITNIPYLLIVNKGDIDKSIEPLLKQSIEEALPPHKYRYQFWDKEDSPKYEDLAEFDAIIWSLDSETISTKDIESLKKYLETGKNLLIMGNGIDGLDNEFLSAYAHTSMGMKIDAVKIRGNKLDDYCNNIELSTNSKVTELLPNDKSALACAYMGGDSVGIIRTEGLGYKIFLVPINIKEIIGQDEMNKLMGSALSWFNADIEPPMITAFMPANGYEFGPDLESIDIQAVTNEASECRYDKFREPLPRYEDMKPMDTADRLTHTVSLQEGEFIRRPELNSLVIKCRDNFFNTMSDQYSLKLKFTVSNYPPIIKNISLSPDSLNEQDRINISISAEVNKLNAEYFGHQLRYEITGDKVASSLIIPDTLCGDNSIPSTSCDQNYFIIKPEYNHSGSYMMNIEVKDIFENKVFSEARKPFNLNIVDWNRVPSINAEEQLVAIEKAYFEYNLSAYDQDSLNTLSFSDDTDMFDVFIQKIKRDNDGINYSARIAFVPKPINVGDNIITISVTDGQSIVDKKINLKVLNKENDPPVIESILPQISFVGSAFKYKVIAHDPDSPTITYSIENKPIEVNIDPISGEITYSPLSTGQHTLIVKVSDGVLSSKANLTLNVYSQNNHLNMTIADVSTEAGQKIQIEPIVRYENE